MQASAPVKVGIIMRLRSIYFLLSVLSFLIPRVAHSIDRDGFVGVWGAESAQFQPSTDRGDLTYGIDLAYFFVERWAGVLSWDLGMEGTQRVGLAVGPQLFIFLDEPIKPYLSTKLVYSIDPAKGIGWRINVGGEWDLVQWTKINNLRLFFETGLTQLYINDGNDLFAYEVLRAGLAWSY